MIPLTPCVSSNVAAWGYDNGTLAVKFKGGSTYHYADVPGDLAAQMGEPGVSIGKFIAQHIRGKFVATLQPKETI
jgi:hypothetical protein